MTPLQISEIFTYHPPTPQRAAVHEMIRDMMADVAQTVNGQLPDCREKSLAITAIQEASMWANAALAIHGERHV